MKTVTARVPKELLQDIKEIEREEKTERAEVVRRLLDDAAKRWKLKKALDKLREGNITLRTAAKIAGLSYLEMLDEAERAGITIGYDLSNLQADLEMLKKEK